MLGCKCYLNERAWYLNDLGPFLSTGHRSGCARSAIFAAAVCALAGLCLTGCGKSATQYIDRGNQLFAQGQYGDATLNYRNAIKKNPGSGEAYYRLGLSLL